MILQGIPRFTLVFIVSLFSNVEIHLFFSQMLVTEHSNNMKAQDLKKTFLKRCIWSTESYLLLKVPYTTSPIQPRQAVCSFLVHPVFFLSYADWWMHHSGWGLLCRGQGQLWTEEVAVQICDLPAGRWSLRLLTPSRPHALDFFRRRRIFLL